MDGKKLLKLSTGLAVLLFLAFLSRLPSLFEPARYGDEGIYLTLGLALRKGLVFYKDIHDNKPPMLYLLAAVAGSQFWFRFILLWWHLLNVYLIYFFVFKIFNKKSLALIAGTFFLLFNITQEGNIPNSEIFMVLPTTAAFWLVYENIKSKSQKTKLKRYLLAGVLLSLAMLFKMPAGFSLAAVICFFVFFDKPEKIFQLPRSIFYLTAGFLILPLVSIIYYWLHGALFNYLKAAFFQNIGYLSSWAGEWKQPFFSLSSALFQRSLTLLVILVVLYLLRKKLSKVFLLIALWFFFDLFGALLSSRPYPHYLIQVAPALSILVVYLVGSKKILEKIVVFSAVVLLVFSFLYYKFWRYPVVSYYVNYGQFLLGQKTKQEYFSFFGGHVNQLYETAKLIKGLTEPEEFVFVWETEPTLYALSQRLPPGRYTAGYHIIDFDGWQETIKAIEEQQPIIIVKTRETKRFDQLDKIIERDYFLLKEIDGTVIFKKR